MSTGSAVQQGAASGYSIERAIALCTEALAICDALKLSQEIGARLQHVICSLEDIRTP
ncbi:MAG TPA: hypothetical protein VK485_07430 [Sphingomicrobium sp.]|nr:hypothetical protein [Sphingomicrobium sp.]